MPRGAGGTNGGLMPFFLGLAMMIGGGYMFLNSVRIHHNIGFGRGLYNFGGVNVTSGMILIPFIFGIVLTFYNSKNPLGFILWAGSMVALVFGVLQNTTFSLAGISLFDLIVILVLAFGGLGIFLSSLRELNRHEVTPDKKPKAWP